MEMYIKVNSKMIYLMEMDNTSGKMAQNIKDNLQMDLEMEMESIAKLIDIKMNKESLFKLLKKFIQDFTKIPNWTDKLSMFAKKEKK